MTQRVLFELTLRSPLSIVTDRKSSSPGCLDHVPGSSLRGAIVSAYRRQHGEDEVFRRLIAPGRNRYPFLFPGPQGVSPYPRSVMSCKREGPAHGVKDVLIPRVQSLDSGLAKTEALANILVCDRCGEPRKPQSGYQVGLEPVPTAVRLFNMHVGIDRRRVSASPGILYGIESIAPTYQAEDGAWHPMKLTGVGQLAQDDVEVLNEVCSEPIWLGKNRSRGNGQADLALRVLEPARDRVETIVSGCRTLQKLLGTEEGSVFTIDVVSPIIAYDRYLRATSEPAEWLPADLKPQVMDRLQLTTTVSGWDMATGLPKDETSAVAPGTVVVVISPLPAKEVGERLATLETTGVGERLCEGFGQAKFNDTFRFRGE